MDPKTDPGLVVLLSRLSKRLFRQVDESVLGMDLKEYMVLTYLGEGGVAQQALAENLHMDENNLVLLLNGMESAGLVSRRRDPDDRRRHIVELTPKGRKALDRGERGMSTLEDELFGSLTAAERATLKRLALRILNSPAGAKKTAEVTRA